MLVPKVYLYYDILLVYIFSESLKQLQSLLCIATCSGIAVHQTLLCY